MLEFINFEILDKTKTFATDILLKFEDKDIDKEKLLFIKDTSGQLQFIHRYQILNYI